MVYFGIGSKTPAERFYFIMFCPLNHSSSKFFKSVFFPVCGTSVIATASRYVKTLRYENRHLALNSFIWWCGGWTGSRTILHIGHGRSGSYSLSLYWITALLWPGRGKAYVQIWVPKSLFEAQNSASLVMRQAAKSVLKPSVSLWPFT